jgi:hypothetical protein
MLRSVGPHLAPLDGSAAGPTSRHTRRATWPLARCRDYSSNACLPEIRAGRVFDQRAALLDAWERVRPGDRPVAIVDAVESAAELVDSWLGSAEDAACVSPINASADVT